MCCTIVSDSQNVSSFTINESAHYNNTTVNCKILSQNVVTFLTSKLAVSPTKSLYEMSEMTSNASSVFYVYDQLLAPQLSRNVVLA